MTGKFRKPSLKVAIPVGVPDIAQEGGWLKDLSFYITLKSCFNNSCVYNYSSRSLESSLKSIFGIKASHNYISTRVSAMVELGLARKTGSNLILSSFADLQKIAEKEFTSQKRIVIFTSKSIKDQNTILQGRFIKKFLQKQEFQIKRKLDAVLLLKKSQGSGSLSPAEVRRLKSHNREFGYGLREKANTELVLTIKNISDILGVSIPTAQKIKKDLVRLKFLKSTFVKGQIVWWRTPSKAVDPFMFSSEKSLFMYNGSLYEAPRCIISMGTRFTSNRGTVCGKVTSTLKK